MQTVTNDPHTPAAIRVQARLFALYREAAGSDMLALQVPANSTVRELWSYLLAVQPNLERAGAMMAATAFAINGTWARPDQALHDGDEVAFLPPVSGG